MIAPIRRILLVESLVCALAFSQPDSANPVTRTGMCSSASASNNDRFTIACDVAKEQGEALLKIVNTILESHLDPDSVMSKLDEISSGIQDSQKRAGDRIITEAQAAAMTRILRRSPGKSVYVVLLSDREANAYGKALIRVFTDSGWKVNINQVGTLAMPAYGIYATADPTLLGALAEAGLSVRGAGDIPAVPPGTPAVLVGLKPY